jgi:hypothetical protein
VTAAAEAAGVSERDVLMLTGVKPLLPFAD